MYDPIGGTLDGGGAAAYSAMHPLARGQIEQLQTLLAARPSTPGGTMPYLPLNNAAQVFHSQVAYLAFANGAGVRYVTAFSQDASPVTNQRLIYTFQGLTEDGQYYVAAFFPVTTAVLPDTVEVEDWEAFSVNYSTYVAEMKAALNDLTPLDFTPELTVLDAVVASLRVEPEVELSGAETTMSPVEPGRIGPIGVYQVYDGDSGLYRLYHVVEDGRSQQVAEQRYPLLPAPDAAHAVYMDDGGRLWLVDLADGSERQLAEGSELSWLHLWGDADTLLAEDGSRLVVFDLVRQTAITVFTWQPAQFGALPPSPVWSIDGKWLAIEVWANNEAESGLWVLPAGSTVLLAP